MSLNGTLETFPLLDVLALLSATKKSGELQVNGGRGQSRVWLDKGDMVGADVPRATTFVDALFEMLRLTSGNFVFDNDGRPTSPSEPNALEPLLLEAQSRLGEWKTIEAVVPSVACPVKLAAKVPGEHVSITAEQWRTLVAVANSHDVEGVMKSLGRGEFDSCRMLKDLVQIGLVTIEDAPPPEAEAATKAPAAPAQAGTGAAAAPPARRAGPAALAAVSRLAASTAGPDDPSAGDASTAAAGAGSKTAAGAESADAEARSSKPADGDDVPARVPLTARTAGSSGDGAGSADAGRRPVDARTSGSTDDPAKAAATRSAAGTQARDDAPAKAKAKAAPAPAAADDQDSERESADLMHQLAQLQGAPASRAARPAGAGAAKTAPAPSAAKTAPAAAGAAKSSAGPAAGAGAAKNAAPPAAGAKAAPAGSAKPAAAAGETPSAKNDEASEDKSEDKDDEGPKPEEPLNRGLLLKFLNSVRS